jgi:hypothetical protein
MGPSLYTLFSGWHLFVLPWHNRLRLCVSSPIYSSTRSLEELIVNLDLDQPEHCGLRRL